MGRGAPLGVGVIGAGFIGAVHARSALLAGGRVTGVVGVLAAKLGGGRGQAGRRARLRVARGARRVPGRGRGPRLHAQPPARAARARRAPGGQARDLREAAGARRGGREPARGRGRRERPPGSGALRLPLLPDGARGPSARARRARAAASACSTAPTSRTGSRCRRTTTGAWTRTSAAPRGPSPTSGRTGATWPSSSRAIASRGSPRGWRRCCRSAASPRAGPPSTAATGKGRPARCTPRTPRSCSSRPRPGRSAPWS